MPLRDGDARTYLQVTRQEPKKTKSEKGEGDLAG